MKILYFFDGRRRENKIIQIDFILRLQKYCQLYIYGPQEQEYNGNEISPLSFDRRLRLVDVVKELDPNLVLFPEYSISNLFINNLGNIKNNSNIPKVLMEVDYYNILDDINWPKEIGIDLLIDRGTYPDEAYRVPHVWLPWSANEIFYTSESSNYLENRINKVAYTGGGRYSRNKYYLIRQKAIRLLEEKGLLDYIGVVPPNIYKNYISNYICCLSCSFKNLRMAPAKTFEIMASGSLLLTTKFLYEKNLFGDKQCFLKYEEDCSNLLDLAELILSDKKLVSEITSNALSVVNTSHLHSHRIEELYNILKALLDGKDIPRKWGI